MKLNEIIDSYGGGPELKEFEPEKKIVKIDKKGYVFIVDPETFEETPTEQNINEIDKSPVTIKLATGEIS